MLTCSPFAPGALYDWMWDCCAGTHASPSWHDNGNDCYAAPGAVLVAPIAGRVVRAGVPGIGQGERVGIEGATHSVYLAHMTALRVREGEQVEAGQPVGVVWDFSPTPPHLHFSLARGSYGGGSFVNPRDELHRTAEHVTGRTYRALGVAEAPPAKPDGFWLEELPWHPITAPGNVGPRVLGPWSSASGRDGKLAEMKAADEVVSPMGDGVRFYIYHWRPGSYSVTFRRGPWDDAAKQRNARSKLERATGRAQRPFKGRANSIYPWF